MGTIPTITDAALVAAIADGETSALRELYERHGAWLHARLMRRCNDREVVVEVVQDTFVALWKDARRFRHDGEVGAWLWGIAFRRMVSRLRSRHDVVLLLLEHLVPELGDLLVVNLNIAVEFFAIALIRRKRSAIRLKAQGVRLEFLLDTSDVSWERRDLSLETRDLAVKRLKTQRQSEVLQH